MRAQINANILKYINARRRPSFIGIDINFGNFTNNRNKNRILQYLLCMFIVALCVSSIERVSKGKTEKYLYIHGKRVRLRMAAESNGGTAAKYSL